MNTNLEPSSQTLYEADFLLWIETTAEQLRNRDYAQVDWESLIEEIESMGRSERSSVRSNLVVLLLHLLKWQYQPDHRTRSWRSSIVEHRRRLEDSLEDSPSLNPYLAQVLDKCYDHAVKQAAAETGLAEKAFPTSCPFTIVDLLDPNFLPQ